MMSFSIAKCMYIFGGFRNITSCVTSNVTNLAIIFWEFSFINIHVVTTMTDSITTMSGIRRGLVNQLN